NTEILIIALTANAFDSDKTQAMEAGCNDFLAKPLKKKPITQNLFYERRL
ncbi:MAG: response regulator, partial [Odoribacter splanchnicus]|nr:response regulator [Odoribacter splanchnicus]